MSLLPPEYRNDVFGVSWPVIFLTVFVGFASIFLLVCRSRSAKGRMINQQAVKTIEELRTQLDNLSKEKVDVENDLRTKENEVGYLNDTTSTSFPILNVGLCICFLFVDRNSAAPNVKIDCR